MAGSPVLVVMGGNSCSEGRGLNPSTVYRMDIFHIDLLSKQYTVFFVCRKDENKQKGVRGRPI